jgi:hypothetical protein
MAVNADDGSPQSGAGTALADTLANGALSTVHNITQSAVTGVVKT